MIDYTPGAHLLAVIAARMLPVGNFALINITAGALGVRFRDYLIGNVIGLLPGVLAPVRLPEDVGGVVYRTAIAKHLRGTNPYDVFDCRLALALPETRERTSRDNVQWRVMD